MVAILRYIVYFFQIPSTQIEIYTWDKRVVATPPPIFIEKLSSVLLIFRPRWGNEIVVLRPLLFRGNEAVSMRSQSPYYETSVVKRLIGNGFPPAPEQSRGTWLVENNRK